MVRSIVDEPRSKNEMKFLGKQFPKRGIIKKWKNEKMHYIITNGIYLKPLFYSAHAVSGRYS